MARRKIHSLRAVSRHSPVCAFTTVPLTDPEWRVKRPIHELSNRHRAAVNSLPMLSPLAEQAIAHWKEHRPRMYAELEKAGTLHARAQKAADQTNDELSSAIEDGMDYYAAWEMLRERYIFLPSEEDVPLLGERPDG